ncbi:hemolysin family protein [Pelagibacterium luteolum]|uniref:CBS domain-containing protein n=1 Tax=Pelagibacterium luteolum TaxID=440168 RepID=A0A1G7SLU3_9HYPH|nr:hemolysin family protein [Pelagibacterium luteolum]SDG23948.1 CBS domain-containing protein [Pelagibacterium luteolum]
MATAPQMTDIDQSSAAARRPHRPSGDDFPTSSPLGDKKPSLWARLRAFVPGKSASLRTGLKEALDAPALPSDTSFSASERTILQNVLKLGELRVEDVMVPRADIEAVEIGVNVGFVIERFRQVGHSRMPVYEESLDKVVGMIHIKDVLEEVTEPAKTAAPTAGNGANGHNNQSPIKFVTPVLKQKIGKAELVRKVLFVPPSMPVTDLLAQMQATRMHMAVVIDEYGGTDGLVTIEDLLEAVVGDIEDEHDEGETQMLRAIGDDVFVADARVELADLIETIGTDFDPGEYAEDVDTLGGLIFALAGRVPVRGEVVSKLKGFEFEITRADARRVKQVRITRKRRKQRLLIAGPKPETAQGDGTTPTENQQAAE